MESANNDMKRYIKLALEKENIENYEIAFTGGTQKSDGYAGDMIFATVSISSEDGLKRNIELAIKSGKPSFMATHRHIYERETYFYEVIIPEFSRFQINSKIENTSIFNSIPKCYKTISNTSMEVLIMENLRKSGYVLHDRKKPLDKNHQKLILREYGKFHAISFALRDKRRHDFQKLVTNFDELLLEFFNESFRNMIQHGMERACNILKRIGEKEMFDMCTEIFQKGADKVIEKILTTVEPKSAILHGDCWNNNFLFKYEFEDKNCPSKVAILDWQVSRLHSPVLDLSYFIYMSSSEEQLEYFDELLDTYYNSFSSFLKDLGCDPEKLFSYSTLKSHWKNYGMFGMLMVTSFLHMTICDEEESPEFNDGPNFGDKITNMSIKNESEFKKRLVAVISHYYKYNRMK